MARRKHKIVILGSHGYDQESDKQKIVCFPWKKVKNIKNIRDYDTVIIDLLNIQSEDARKELKWKEISNILDYRNSMDILFNHGMLIILGDPRFEIPAKNEEDGSDILVPFLNWTGIDFTWDEEPGDTVQIQNDYEHRNYTEYLEKLKKWNYSLQTAIINRKYLSKRFNLNKFKENHYEVDLYKDYFCINRYRNALAFLLRYRFIKKRYEQIENEEKYGRIVFLPQISASNDETIQIVLRDILGIEANLPEPEWLEHYTAPGQKKIDAEIDKMEFDLKEKYESLQQVRIKKDECRECLKLLYEREYALEPIVRNILRGFGAHVEDPEETNKEDGWITIQVGQKIYEGVLEIKSTKSNTFSEDGRKQLLDWIDRGRTTRNKNYKGIFIGNSAVDNPLTERPWAFSDSWKNAASLSEISALKTEDLYVIHVLNAQEKIDLNLFWEEVFQTNGIFDMKKYYDLLTPKEKAD